MKYIDAERLEAEIERRIVAYQKNFDKADNKIAKLSTDGRIASLKGILPFITSLQHEQPEVDLAEEITRFFSNNAIPYEHLTDWPLLKNTALYFYELGLKARRRNNDTRTIQ